MGRNRDMNDVVLKAEHLTKRYPIKKGLFGKSRQFVHALEDVSFELHRGETFAIVGESGCGKSTTGKCVLRLTEPTEGTVTLDGEDFTALSGDALVRARQKMKLIFQDPYSSLNPRMTVADIIAEPIDIAGTYKTKAERDARVEEVMGAVGLDLSYKYRYPHEFSGGQRQRIGIARAIVLEPEVVVCDEPVSALDVSVQAKVINLLAPGRPGPVLRLHQPRPFRRQAHLRHGHGHVPGSRDGAGGEGRAVREATAPLHPGPSRRHPAHPSRAHPGQAHPPR